MEDYFDKAEKDNEAHILWICERNKFWNEQEFFWKLMHPSLSISLSLLGGAILLTPAWIVGIFILVLSVAVLSRTYTPSENIAGARKNLDEGMERALAYREEIKRLRKEYQGY